MDLPESEAAQIDSPQISSSTFEPDEEQPQPLAAGEDFIHSSFCAHSPTSLVAAAAATEGDTASKSAVPPAGEDKKRKRRTTTTTTATETKAPPPKRSSSAKQRSVASSTSTSSKTNNDKSGVVTKTAPQRPASGKPAGPSGRPVARPQQQQQQKEQRQRQRQSKISATPTPPPPAAAAAPDAAATPTTPRRKSAVVIVEVESAGTSPQTTPAGSRRTSAAANTTAAVAASSSSSSSLNRSGSNKLSTATSPPSMRRKSTAAPLTRRNTAAASSAFLFHEAKRRVDQAAIRLQRWWRLISSQRKYKSQLQRLRNTNAARVIQFAWLKYTYRVTPRLIPDFQRWALLYRQRLLSEMRRLLRRELLHRRHAAIVIMRSVRWFVLRPLRAHQIKRFRAAARIQEWYREITRRVSSRKLRLGVADAIIDMFKEEYGMREMMGLEEHLEFVQWRVLASEHKQLVSANDPLEAWRLFLRRGGYDERIGRTQERLTTAEEVARADLVEDEAVSRDNLRIERVFQRRGLEELVHEQQDAAVAAASASSQQRGISSGLCCGGGGASPQPQLATQMSTPCRLRRADGLVAGFVDDQSSMSPATAVVSSASCREASLVGIKRHAAAAAQPQAAGAAEAAFFRDASSNTPRRIHRHTMYTSISSLL